MKYLVLSLISLITVNLIAQDLQLSGGDVKIIQSPEGGYHLYIKKKAGIESVLLTETTKDPSLKADNYAYRALEYNAINGDEKRLLDGVIIPKEKAIWSLIDSTVEQDTPLGEAYHIWIPYIIAYGYSWSRQGEVEVQDGTFFNIRAFSKPYGDYAGTFIDNPFKLKLTQKPVPPRQEPPDVRYMSDTVSAFKSLADTSRGQTRYAAGPADIIPLIQAILENPQNKSLDLVFVIDATESMVDDIATIRELIEPMLDEHLNRYPSWRVSLVLYKDYFEDFLVRVACTFTKSLPAFRKSLNAFRVQGGRDIPEAVYEGLHAALMLPWNEGADRKIILIGDAPPHPKPRGKISREVVENLAREREVEMNVIIIPHGETY
ncbi:MAG TPA: VWA domain-containing protein [Treponemataceae bacterium]|nr:VWA domain-containing protein [Treponemataceae bacterium]